MTISPLRTPFQMKITLALTLSLIALSSVRGALLEIGLNYRVPEVPEIVEYADVIYIDPSAPVDGDGTLDSPRDHFFGLSLQASNAYLIKAGTVLEGALVNLPADIYIGRYGEGANPIFRGKRESHPEAGNTFVGIDIEKFGGGGGSWDKILSFSGAGVTFVDCRIVGLPNSDDGIYPYYTIKGSGGDRLTFYNCEIGFVRSDGLYLRAGLKDLIVVGNYFHHINLGSGPGDGIQMSDGFDRAYFANNYMDRSGTPGKFNLIINSSRGATTGIEAEWNTFLPPESGVGGASSQWYPGDHARMHHNLIGSRSGVSGIASGDGVANEPAPYGIRDNHFFGPSPFYGVSKYPASNRVFASLEAYEQYLATTPGAVRYGSDRFSPDRDAGPTVPANVSGTGVYNSVQLTWDASVDAHGVAGYRIVRDGRTVGYALGTNHYSDTGLEVSTSYTYEIVAYDFARIESPSSLEVTVSTTDTVDPEPPTAPADLQGIPKINTIELSWAAASDNLGVVEYRVYRGDTLLAEQSATGYQDRGLMPNSIYSYTVEAVDRSGNSARSIITVQTLGVGLPPGWNHEDIGGSESAETPVEELNGVITLNGAGADMWNSADSFGFAYRPIEGDGEITVRVLSMSDSHDWAKVGVMIRETLDAPSRNVALLLTPSLNVPLQYRADTSGDTESTAQTYTALPLWLRLARSGNTFTGYISANGQSWTSVGSVTVEMGASALVGLALSSHDETTRAIATFEQLTVTSGNDSDLDQDGLDDVWEGTHFGNLQAQPQEDPDGDGFSNRIEFIVGTDPRDGASRLEVSLLSSDPSRIRVAPVAAGVRYTLEAGNDLELWTEAAEFEAIEDAVEHVFTDQTSSGSSRFYRLRVERP